MKKLLLFSVGLMSLMTPAVSHAAKVEASQQRVVVTEKEPGTWNVTIKPALRYKNAVGAGGTDYLGAKVLTAHDGNLIDYNVEPIEGYIPARTQIQYRPSQSDDLGLYVFYDGKPAQPKLRLLDENGKAIQEDIHLDKGPLTVGGSFTVDLPTIEGYIIDGPAQVKRKASNVNEVVEVHYHKVDQPTTSSPTVAPQQPKSQATDQSKDTKQGVAKKTDPQLPETKQVTDPKATNEKDTAAKAVKVQQPEVSKAEETKPVNLDRSKGDSQSKKHVDKDQSDQKPVVATLQTPTQTQVTSAKNTETATKENSGQTVTPAVKTPAVSGDRHGSDSNQQVTTDAAKGSTTDAAKNNISENKPAASRTQDAKTSGTNPVKQPVTEQTNHSQLDKSQNKSQNKETDKQQPDSAVNQTNNLHPATGEETAGVKKGEGRQTTTPATKENHEGKSNTKKVEKAKKQKNGRQKHGQQKHGQQKHQQAAPKKELLKNQDKQTKNIKVTGIDETGATLYSKTSKTTVEKLNNVGIAFEGYDWQFTTFDEHQNEYLLHYQRKTVRLKVNAVDENGAVLGTQLLVGKFGETVAYAPAVVAGYHPINNFGGTVKLNSLLPADIMIKYAKDQRPATSSQPTQSMQSTSTATGQEANATNNVNEAKPSKKIGHKHKGKATKAKTHHGKNKKHKHIHRSRRLSHRHSRRSVQRWASKKHVTAKRTRNSRLPQTGDSNTKKSQMIGMGLLLALIGPKIARKF